MIRARALVRVALTLVAAGPCAAGSAAQTPPAPPPATAAAGSGDAFLDADARGLHARARERWLQIDGSLVRYQARVSRRIGAALRMPLRDRTIYASEMSARVIWERDGGVAVQMLASKERLPSGFNRSGSSRRRARVFDAPFDPAGDPLLLGLSSWSDDDDLRFEHPLDVGAERHYRFRTADTLVLSFPDGRTLRTIQLELIPRRDDSHLLAGALWIEPESGSLVRAVYRLARPLDIEMDTNELDDDDDVENIPGVFKPFEIELTMVAVDYALWDLRVWMPRSLRAEGTVRAGVVKVPAVLEMSYDIEDVVTDADEAPPLGLEAALARLAAAAAGEAETTWTIDPGSRRRGGRPMRYILPEDPAWLETSPHLPAPVWENDADFVRSAELDELMRVLGDVPGPAQVTTLATFDWGIQGADLVRYNRVEGLSIGARGSVRFGATGVPMSASLTARIGTADLQPRGTLALTRETLARSLTLSAYRELQLVDPSTRALGLGNSVSALLFGRDDGDYWQSTGVGLTWTPPRARRASYALHLYAERQDPVARETQGSVFHWVGLDDGFRPGTDAAHADQTGVELTVSPWWGGDPQGAGGGFEVALQGEGGDYEFGRARLGARASLPLPRGGRIALAVGGGTTVGDAPAQRRWTLGGPFSLRGFAPGVVAGPTFLSARAELIGPLRRMNRGSALRLALFTDGGWAGERDQIRWDAAVASVGIGLSVLDGILRLDAAWGWKGPSGRRVDLYLDGLL